MSPLPTNPPSESSSSSHPPHARCRAAAPTHAHARALALALALAFTLLLSHPSIAQPASPQPPTPQPAATIAISAELRRALPNLEARLTALSPDNPEHYFLLGEEVADVAIEDSERAIARTLYLIALDLDLARPEPKIAGSICLALAELVSSERDRLWLQAMARTVDARHAAPEWSNQQTEEIPRSLAYATATALGAIRSGDGTLARQLLAQPGVERLLIRYDLLLQPAGGVTRLLRDATLWPCPACRNRRVDRARTPGPPPVCTTCLGDPGPRMTDAEIVTHLRLETLLLSGNHTSWAAQMTIDDGAPLRDPDPSAVSRTLGVDTTRSLYRNGAWITPPGA
jgi:hypothetical protein